MAYVKLAHVVIISNCASHKTVHSSWPLLNWQRIIVKGHGAPPVTKFPKLTAPQRHAKSLGCCSTIRVPKISTAMRRDRGTFVFGKEPGTVRRTTRSKLLSLLLRLIDRGRSRGKGSSSLRSSAREGKLESAREVKHAEIRESQMIAC